MNSQLTKLFATALVVCFASHVLAQSAENSSRTDFQNLIYTNTPTLAPGTLLTNNYSASVAFFSGNIGAATNELVGSTNIVRPNDGQGIYLLASAIGQPVGMFTVPFNLFVQGTGSNTPTPKPERWFQLSQTVSLQATPGRYYKFSQWSDGDTSNPRSVVAGATNGYTAVFTVTNGVTLFTTNINGVDLVTELGKPLVFLDGQYYPHDVVVATTGTLFSVTIVPTYTNGTNRYTLEGSDPAAGTLYTGAFNVTSPFRIRVMGFTSLNTNPREADAVVSLHKSTPGGGSIAAVPQTDFFNGSASAALTATPDAGWSFLSWSGDSSETNPVITLAMDQPKAVSAIFGTTVSATVNDVTRGYVTNLPAQSLYAYGSVLRLAAVPLTTNYFGSWGGAQGVAFGSVSPVEFSVTNANPGIEATFANLSGSNKSLAVATIGEGDVSKSPSANFYSSGANVTLTATPRAGQSFVSWSGDASGTSTNLSVTMTNSKVIYAQFAVTQAKFQLSSASYNVNEADGSVLVTVHNIGVLSNTVTLTTSDGTATGGNGVTTGDYATLITNLSFSSGPSSQHVAIPIRNQFLLAPARTFQVSLSGAPLSSPSNATVTISYTGTLTTNGSQLLQAYPGPLPQTTGTLVVSNNPTASTGQWKFRWDDIWRTEAESITNLEAGSYELEFRDVAGYVPFPRTTPKFVTSGGLSVHEAEYLPTFTPSGYGALQINFASPPLGAAWRLRGEGVWRDPNTTATNLLPGVYEVQFRTIHGYSAPSLAQQLIGTSLITPPAASYTPVSVPTNAPGPLASFADINVSPTNTPRMPYVFNGQLLSPINSYGSGVAVASNVVLTAAHVVFDYATLSYVGPVYWSFQKHEGDFTPRPLTARGWNVMSGYAAARTNDFYTNGLNAAQSSPQSRNYDVAALYFAENAARGGFGGYVSSDSPANEWLTGGAAKMIVGYPVDAAADGYTNVIAGKMHTTQTRTNSFTQQNDRVYATTDFLTFGGNSGGPVYVQHTNNLFYPAAVYLGRVSGASVMRSIDSNVVDLIVRAATLGDLGTNNTGGGVITLVGSSVTAGNPAYVQVILGPAAALQAGAGWRLSGDTVYGSTNYFRTITSSNATIQFKDIAGWNPPAITNFVVQGGVINTIPGANYTVISPQMSFNSINGFGISGTTNTIYRIEYTTNLAGGVWSPLQTNTITTTGFNLVLPWPPTNGLPAAFYRAVWLP